MSEKKKSKSTEPNLVPTGEHPMESGPAPIFQKFAKGALEHEHHLLKLNLAKMLKNRSWRWRSPDIQEVEHVHFFHSINDTTMQKNRYCSPTGGHFHEVTIETNEAGEITSAKCGPALHHVTRKLQDGSQIKRVERVRFERAGVTAEEQLDEHGQPIMESEVTLIYDQHVHTLTYMGTEKFTSSSKNDARKAQQGAVRGMMEGPASRQAGKMNALTNGPEHDKVKGVLREGAESSQG